MDREARIIELERERDYWREQAEQSAHQVQRLLVDQQRQNADSTAPQQSVEHFHPRPVDAVFVPEFERRLSLPPARFMVWLGRTSIATLRVSLGLVFLGFGLLKYFPDVSPAEEIAQRTVDTLTFGLISGDLARILVATLEVAIGLCLVSGKFLRLGLGLLAIASVGILAPLLLFPEDLFARKYHAPTLLGQYVLKDIVLLAAGFVVVARLLGERTQDPEGRAFVAEGHRKSFRDSISDAERA